MSNKKQGGTVKPSANSVRRVLEGLKNGESIEEAKGKQENSELESQMENMQIYYKNLLIEKDRHLADMAKEIDRLEELLAMQEQTYVEVGDNIENQVDSAMVDELNAKNAELAAKDEELLQVKGKFSRLLQDFDNFKARNSESKFQAFEEGKEKAIISFVGFGDDIDRAIASCMDENTKKGLLLLQANFNKILEREDITVIDPLGEVFDPEIAEAISSMPALEGQESGRVLQVFAKGYKRSNKIIKFAQVIVTV